MGSCWSGMTKCLDADGDGDFDWDDVRAWSLRGATALKSLTALVGAISAAIARVNPELASDPGFKHLTDAVSVLNEISDTAMAVGNRSSRFNTLLEAVKSSLSVLKGESERGPTTEENSLRRTQALMGAIKELTVYLDEKAPAGVKAEVGLVKTYLENAERYVHEFGIIKARAEAATTREAAGGSTGLEDVRLVEEESKSSPEVEGGGGGGSPSRRRSHSPTSA